MPYIHPRARQWLDWRAHIHDLTHALRRLLKAIEDDGEVFASDSEAVSNAEITLNRDHPGEPEDVGELNYVLTTTIKEYVDRRTLSYGLLNDVIGVLDAVRSEFYRRVVAPYEDKKIKQNGDVY